MKKMDQAGSMDPELWEQQDGQGFSILLFPLNLVGLALCPLRQKENKVREHASLCCLLSL